MITSTKRSSAALFLLALVTIYGCAVATAGLVERLDRGQVVAWALTVDLVLLVPLLYYLLLARPRGWPALSTAPVFLLSLGGAALVLPAGHRDGVELLGTLALPVELFLLGWIGYRTWTGVSAFRREAREGGGVAEPDLLERFRAAALEAVRVPRAADALAYELAVFYYALLSWRHRHVRSSGPPERFSYHRAGSYGVVLVGLLCAVVAELVVVHVLLVGLGVPAAAWILSVLSLYGFLWLLGDYRAMVLRPVRVDGRGIEVRIGLRWTAFLPFDRIERVQRRSWRDGQARPPDVLGATVLARPRHRIVLDGEVEVRGLYGLRRRVRAVDLAVDDAPRFEAALARLSPRPLSGAENGREEPP